jgi:hypothetical protein
VVDVDWWAPLGDAGRLEIHEPLAPEEVQRRLAASAEVDVPLGRAEVGDHVVEFVARGRTRLARTSASTVGLLDLSAPPAPGGGFQRPVTLLGATGEAVRHEDDARGSRLRGALRYLRLTLGARVWAWHYTGGRAAGERLVLVPGGHPSGAAPRVVTHPSARGRSWGNPTGGASAETHVTTWTPDASAAEVLLVELLATTWLGAVVDYRAARIAGGFGELLASAPKPDANTT